MKYVFVGFIVFILMIVLASSVMGNFEDTESMKPHDPDPDNKFDYE